MSELIKFYSDDYASIDSIQSAEKEVRGYPQTVILEEHVYSRYSRATKNLGGGGVFLKHPFRACPVSSTGVMVIKDYFGTLRIIP
jgi:hypothetical protein